MLGTECRRRRDSEPRLPRVSGTGSLASHARRRRHRARICPDTCVPGRRVRTRRGLRCRRAPAPRPLSSLPTSPFFFFCPLSLSLHLFLSVFCSLFFLLSSSFLFLFVRLFFKAGIIYAQSQIVLLPPRVPFPSNNHFQLLQRILWVVTFVSL